MHGVGHVVQEEQAQVGLRREDGPGRFVGAGGDHDLGEEARRCFAAASASSGRLQATMPPKALCGSQARASRVGLDGGLAGADAAGVGVLDDGDGGLGELGDQRQRGVGVVEVVEGELLALELGGGGQAPGRRRRRRRRPRWCGFSP